jgi:hypothetical protein
LVSAKFEAINIAEVDDVPRRAASAQLEALRRRLGGLTTRERETDAGRPYLTSQRVPSLSPAATLLRPPSAAPGEPF